MNTLEKIAAIGTIAGALILGEGLYLNNKYVKGYGIGTALASISMGVVGYATRKRKENNPKILSMGLSDYNPNKDKEK